MKSTGFCVVMVVIFMLMVPQLVQAQNVLLQAVTPGVQQAGHMNISGVGLFGGVGIGTTTLANSGLNCLVSVTSASTFNGVRSYVKNAGTGAAYSGYFYTYADGTGYHYGLSALAYGNSTRSTYGLTSYGSNVGSGPVYGGYFSTATAGTGVHFGIRSYGDANSTSTTYGTYSYGRNSGSGEVFGGYFETSSSGTGIHYGARTYGNAASASTAYGTYAYARNTGEGDAHGIYSEVSSSGRGRHYGVFSTSSGTSTNPTFGVYGYGNNTSSGPVYGGFFETSLSGTGYHAGLVARAQGNSTSETDGVNGWAMNQRSGTVTAGKFAAADLGTGVHYGVWAYERAGGSGAAIYASGDFIASGTKSAVVPTSDGNRLLYAQESTEIWVEDFGQGEIVNGKARVDLDPSFLETVTIDNNHQMRVFVQLTSGLPIPVVVQKNTTGFEVIAQDPINASFDFRIVAKRKGYESERLRQANVGYDDPNLFPEARMAMERRFQQEFESQELVRQNQAQAQESHEFEREQQQQEQERLDSEREQIEQEQSQYQDNQGHSMNVDANVINLDDLPDASLEANLPTTNALTQNHPNPFNPATVIQFDINQAGRVNLKVYNSRGQEVATLVDDNLAAGRHQATFDATGLASGTYFYKLSVNGSTRVKKMEFVK